MFSKVLPLALVAGAFAQTPAIQNAAVTVDVNVNGQAAVLGGSQTVTPSAVSTTSTSATVTSTAAATAGIVDAAARNTAPSKLTDANQIVLTLALTLENLETQFYEQGLQKFDVQSMVDAGLSQTQANIVVEQLIANKGDEESHAKTLSGALSAIGGSVPSGISFNFDTALTDPITFLTVGRTVELAGVAAYAGAAQLLTDPNLLTSAATILTLEARHQSLLNTLNGGSFSPSSFDIALAPEQVLTLVAGFVTGLDPAVLGLTLNAPLSVTSNGVTKFQQGSQLQFKSTNSTENLSCQMLVGGATIAVVQDAADCKIPNSVNGPAVVYLTKSNTPLLSNLQQQNKGDIVAGPAIIFVDAQSSDLQTLFAFGNSASQGFSVDMGSLLLSQNQPIVLGVVAPNAGVLQAAASVTSEASVSTSSIATTTASSGTPVATALRHRRDRMQHTQHKARSTHKKKHKSKHGRNNLSNYFSVSNCTGSSFQVSGVYNVSYAYVGNSTNYQRVTGNYSDSCNIQHLNNGTLYETRGTLYQNNNGTLFYQAGRNELANNGFVSGNDLFNDASNTVVVLALNNVISVQSNALVLVDDNLLLNELLLSGLVNQLESQLLQVLTLQQNLVQVTHLLGGAALLLEGQGGFTSINVVQSSSLALSNLNLIAAVASSGVLSIASSNVAAVALEEVNIGSSFSSFGGALGNVLIVDTAAAADIIVINTSPVLSLGAGSALSIAVV